MPSDGEEIVAVFGKVEQVRDFKGLGVTRITVEIPIEQFVEAAAMLYGKNVLITIAPPSMGGPYGMRRRGDESEPPSTTPAEPKGGALSNLAAVWCKDPVFHKWLRKHFRESWNATRESLPEKIARDVILRTCGINSRKQLDHNEEARKLFDEAFRGPFSEHLREQETA